MVDNLIYVVEGSKRFRVAGTGVGSPVAIDAVLRPGDAVWVRASQRLLRGTRKRKSKNTPLALSRSRRAACTGWSSPAPPKLHINTAPLRHPFAGSGRLLPPRLWRPRRYWPFPPLEHWLHVPGRACTSWRRRRRAGQGREGAGITVVGIVAVALAGVGRGEGCGARGQGRVGRHPAGGRGVRLLRSLPIISTGQGPEQ